MYAPTHTQGGLDLPIGLDSMHREVHPGFDIEWRKLYLLLRERHLRKTITVDSYTIAMANHCRELVQFISTIRRYASRPNQMSHIDIDIT